MLAPWHRRVCVDRALQNKPRHPPSNPPGVDARLADPEEADPGVQQQQEEALESWSPGLSPFLRVRPDLELREEKRIQSRCDLKKKKKTRIVRFSFLHRSHESNVPAACALCSAVCEGRRPAVRGESRGVACVLAVCLWAFAADEMAAVAAASYSLTHPASVPLP